MNGMENKMKKIFCLLAGAGSGVLMAAVVLFALINTTYASGTAGFVIVVLITAVLPWIMETFDKDVYEVLVMEGVAIAVSAIIVYAYIMTVTGGDSFGAYYGEMRSALSIKLGIAHLVSFVFAVGRAYLHIRRSA